MGQGSIFSIVMKPCVKVLYYMSNGISITSLEEDHLENLSHSAMLILMIKEDFINIDINLTIRRFSFCSTRINYFSCI